MTSEFVPSFSVVTAGASEAPAERTALVLHGILGSGQNFRGLARALVKRRPDLALVLVDLRNHGDSGTGPAPQSLQACADDLSAVAEQLGRQYPDLPPAELLIGHSFGGKVAIAASQTLDLSLKQVFVLDSNPGTLTLDKDYEVSRVIAAVRSVPMPAATRQEVVSHLLGQGLSSGLANWMTTNLRRVEDVYQWCFDLDAIETMLIDYAGRDLWDYLAAPRVAPQFQLVVAENSDRWSKTLRRRAEELPAESQCHYHVIPNAGHWLHVDNPGALLDLFESTIASGP